MQKQKQIILILSAMRTGSTLLKALLGSKKTVSHLPEINFQKKSKKQIYKLSDKKNIVLKKPAWMNEIFTYPKIKEYKNCKKIILFREPYNALLSLKKWIFKDSYNKIHILDNFFIHQYWCKVYKNIYEKTKNDKNVFFVKYKQIINQPKKTTHKIFKFLNLKNTKGVNKYKKPKKGWEKGKDDIGKKIKSLKVIKKNNKKHDNQLKKQIQISKGTKRVLKYYQTVLNFN